MKSLHTFWSTHESLGEDFKDTLVNVNPNSLMLSLADTKDDKNKQGNRDNVVIEVKVCGVGTLNKLFLMRWSHINTCSTQIIQYFN